MAGSHIGHVRNAKCLDRHGIPERPCGPFPTAPTGRPAHDGAHPAYSPFMALPIEDYALLGDTGTAALVGRDGSVDWLCLPRFDSPACFAALLGTPEHGRWLISPVGESHCTRRYVGNSFVLETTHTTPTGVVRVIDLMPLGDGRADLVRRIEGVSGTVRMRHEWVVRFGYGKYRPWVTRHRDHHGHEWISAVAGPDMLVLRGSRLPHAEDGHHVDEFDVGAGDRLTFSTTWFQSHHPVPEPLDVDSRIADSIRTSERWALVCDHSGQWRDAVLRSLLVLRLLTHGGTGGIVAAPTTSLPEQFGGRRNWDYRYCWLRDASLTLVALLSSGYVEETVLWRSWLLRAVAGDPPDMQIMYAVDGGRELPERELAHLPGYAGSHPVRIGNGAAEQRQTDVLGEVMSALEMARQLGLRDSTDSWSLQRALVEELAEHWDEPDNGLWEIRGPLRHFTHSRVMVWVAFDRAIAAVERHGLDGPVEKWRELRERVKAEVLERGYDPVRNTFVQHYDTTETDASLLVIPAVGFLPGDDPRVLGTIRAVEEDLMDGGLVMRYRTQSGVDGLPGDEHPFLACSFWLVNAYALAGRHDDACDLMDRLVALANDVGLLSEEYDPVRQRMVGNFPQAFSHLALIGAAVTLRRMGSVRRSRQAGVAPSADFEESLAVLHKETARLMATASRLDDQDVRAPSRCQGWTRAHVLTHLARSADGMGNLVRWAVTGTEVPMYTSWEARDAAIEAGARRDSRELFTDLEDSAARFADLVPHLADEPESVEVQMGSGRKVRAGSLPALRLTEVVFHHVDLDAGYTFADADPGFVKRALDDAVERLAACGTPLSLDLVSDDGEAWTVGGGAQRVSGSHAALLMWLARGVPDGLHSEQPLPQLPPWG
jgi:uncharacterized protein (TIGR03083 family)